MGQLENALENFAKSKSMNPEYDKARNWYDKVTKELESRADLQSTEETVFTKIKGKGEGEEGGL